MVRERRPGELLVRAVGGVLLTLGISAPHALGQSLPAFSGADGAGAYTTGGRGGVVYHVTQLDSGYGQSSVPGTLQYGLSDSNFNVGGVVQPRTIVFDVGGSIWFGRYATDTNGWDSSDRISVGSKVTIAGQTAPGGINIMAGTLKVNGNQAIIRNVTIAAGYGTRGIGADGMPDSYVYDGMNIHADNVMIDHVTSIFATDESISADEFANHTSVQYSNISAGQNYPDLDTNGSYTGHAFGSLWSPGSNATSTIHHNLYAHQKGRLPRVGSSVGTGAYNDFRNNIFYNWLGTAGGGASGQPSFNNFVGNMFLAGAGGENPVGGTVTTIGTTSGGTSIFNGNNSTGTYIYHSGNLKDINKDGDANDGTALANADFGSSAFVGTPYSAGYTGVTDSATAAYDRVLNYMGANWWNRSPIDTRLVNETRTITGEIKAWHDPGRGYVVPGATQVEWDWLLGLRGAASGGIGGTGSYARPVNWDTDGDGMPGVWELAHGINPNAADNNGDFDADGYTNLEEYINEIAEWPAPQPIVWAGGTGRWALINNWDIKWQPSKCDTAQVTSGTATVDAVGQHAGKLQVSALVGAATFNLTGGWIDIANSLEVGTNGVANWTGGLLIAKGVKLTNGGKLIVSPGGDKILRLDTLSIDAASKLDLSDNDLVVNNGSFAAIRDLVFAGYSPVVDAAKLGIISSSGQSAGNTILALLDNALVGSPDWPPGSGQAVAANAVLGKYTYFGDANLDGQVSSDDYALLDSNLGTAPPAGVAWLGGDMNLDGSVTADDYALLDSNLGAGAGNPLGAAVPEPSSLLLMGAAILCGRRKRRR